MPSDIEMSQTLKLMEKILDRQNMMMRWVYVLVLLLVIVGLGLLANVIL